jgi:hypothetical protein
LLCCTFQPSFLFFLLLLSRCCFNCLCSHQSHGSCQQPETGCLTSFSFQDQEGCHSNSHFFCKEDSSAIKESGNKVSLSLGFSSLKRPAVPIGTKVLLNDSIYPHGQSPPEVKEHMFVYEVFVYEAVQWNQNSTIAKVQYINQVICQGGNKYRLYKEGDDVQESIDR